MEITPYQQPSVLRQKRAFARCKPFDVKTKDALGCGARNVLQQRFQSELAAVRRLVRKAAAVQPSEEPPTKRIKASPPPPPVIKAPKKTTRRERGQLKADLEKIASELPRHIMELLMKQSRAIRGDEMEIDLDAVPDETLLELRKQLNEFVRERADQEHQDGDMMAQEEDEDVDILGGVSPLAIAPAPLLLAQEEDIFGDASPVAMTKNLGGSPSSSSSSSSESGTDSDSDCGSDSDSDESVDSPAPAERAATPPKTELIARAKDKDSLERQRKEARCRAREKARQDVLETERAAMPSETIHPTVIKSLGIHEYGLGPYSLSRLLGLFFKIDKNVIEEPQPRESLEEDLEEGEIRL